MLLAFTLTKPIPKKTKPSPGGQNDQAYRNRSVSSSSLAWA
jgi:hypothetical protein